MLCGSSFFLRRRKRLDYKRFEVASQNKSKVIQLVYGMQEIKMNNSEISKRWEWERVQAKLFKVSVKSLALSQYQQAGGFLINQVKNLFITFFPLRQWWMARLQLAPCWPFNTS